MNGSYPASSYQAWVGFSGRIFYVGRVFGQRWELLCRRGYMGKADGMAQWCHLAWHVGATKRELHIEIWPL